MPRTRVRTHVRRRATRTHARTDPQTTVAVVRVRTCACTINLSLTLALASVHGHVVLITVRRERHVGTAMDRLHGAPGPAPRKSSSDSKEKGTPKRIKTTTRPQAKKKRAPPRTQLLNTEERKQIANSVHNEVLLHVLVNVPSKLVSQLFPGRDVYWRSLLPDKLKGAPVQKPCCINTEAIVLIALARMEIRM